MKWSVSYENTPNPHSLKFVTNEDISSETLEINNLEEAKRSPLAIKLLGFPWAQSVFIGKNFVTLTKEDWVDWSVLKDSLASLIQEHLEKGEKVLLPLVKKSSTETIDSEVVKQIKNVLKNEIQPAVAMDGGFIDFVSYEDKKVYLSLQGACAGCPSATITLKEGIEMRLKQIAPEIEEVVAV